MNKKITALITEMNQPLGNAIGNALEVIESVELLKGQCLPEQQDLKDLCVELASHMTVLGGKTSDLDSAKQMVMQTINDGSAFAKFKEIVTVQGGDPDSLDDFSKLPSAKHTHQVKAASDGYIEKLDALAIGKGTVILEAGRATLDSKIDHGVGVKLYKKIGGKVKKGETVFEILYNKEQKLKESLVHFNDVFTISSKEVQKPKLIKKILY